MYTENNYEDIMSVGDWMLTLIVLAIPIVNIIMYFVWAFGSNTNKNKQNFCKATLAFIPIWILLALLFASF